MTTSPSTHATRGQLTRRGRRVVAALSLVPFVLTFLFLGIHKAQAASVPAQMETIVVQSGETLWDIALSVDPESDPRKTVFEIEQINGLSEGSLQVGQQLIVPSR